MGSVQIVGIFYPMWGGGLFFMQCRSAKILTLLLHKCVKMCNVCFSDFIHYKRLFCSFFQSAFRDCIIEVPFCARVLEKNVSTCEMT